MEHLEVAISGTVLLMCTVCPSGFLYVYDFFGTHVIVEMFKSFKSDKDA